VPAAPVQDESMNLELRAAWKALSEGHYEDALARYRALAGREPWNLDVQLGRAASAQATGAAREAAEAWQQALKLDPENVYARSGLASLAQEIDPATAEAQLKALAATNPTGPVYFVLGNRYAGQARWADAQAAWFEAVRLSPEDADYAFNLAVALEHIGQAREAARYYARARELAAKSGRARFDPSIAAARERALVSAQRD
jgi:tetratricopeptide (TPR) repeat protein